MDFITNGVNFNNNINSTNFKKEAPKSTNISKPEGLDENKEKALKIASSAIAAIAIGGLGYLAGKKIGGNKAKQTLEGMLKSGSLRKGVSRKITTPSKLEKIAQETIEATKRSQTAAAQIASGKSANAIKKEATKNLAHNGKKIVKGEIKKAVVSKRQVEQALKQKGVAAHQASTQATKAQKAATHNVTAKTAEGIKAQREMNKVTIEQAQQAATEAKTLAEANKTRKNIRFAKQAENIALTAEATAKKAAENLSDVDIIASMLGKTKNCRKFSKKALQAKAQRIIENEPERAKQLLQEASKILTN